MTSTAVPVPRTSTRPPAGVEGRPGPSRVPGDLLLAAAGIGLGVVLGATLLAQRGGWSSVSGWLVGVGALTAVAGTYGVLLLLLLIARIPPLERRVGQVRLVGWHRRLAPWALGLVAMHVYLTTLGYALAERTDPATELAALVTTAPWVLPALTGFLMLVAAAVTSWRVARRRLRYQTWWTIHLLTYVGIALAFAHQVVIGGPFLSGWARTLWVGLYLAAAGTILLFRVGLPVYRSLRHDLRVAAVLPEGPGVVSVWLAGRDLHLLPARPGQYLNVRFAAPGLRYDAHPYSMSVPPRGDALRLTVKALGDGSTAVASLRPGTRAWVEGPYGALTSDSAHRGRVVLVAAGVGIAPLRAILEDLDRDTEVDVLYRARMPDDLVLRGEIDDLAASRPSTRVHYLVGSRAAYPMTPESLTSLVPDITTAEVFVCGPDGFTELVAASTTRLGTRPEQIHAETFHL